MARFEDVLDFHRRFELIPDLERPQLLNQSTLVFRLGFLQEEVDEFSTAHRENDLPQAVDALLDLVYVVYGTAIMMGVTPEQWSEAWNAVHSANMKKVRARAVGQSKRGSLLDVVKPLGWTAPDIGAVLKRSSK